MPIGDLDWELVGFDLRGYRLDWSGLLIGQGLGRKFAWVIKLGLRSIENVSYKIINSSPF